MTLPCVQFDAIGDTIRVAIDGTELLGVVDLQTQPHADGGPVVTVTFRAARVSGFETPLQRMRAALEILSRRSGIPLREVGR